MKQFPSIEKLDTAILYTLELASSLSILLLAFGLIASMANVLTKGSVLSDSLIMQRIWAWTQCIAIDASVAGTIIRTFRYHAEGEQVKTWLYGLLSLLLLFTAAIVLNIESVQQTLNLTLDSAYVHVFVPVEANTEQLLLSQGEQTANTAQEAIATDEDEQGTNNGERVKAYLLLHPDAKVREVADALTISVGTANKWMSRVKGRNEQGEQTD